MPKIMESIAEMTGGKSYHTYKYSYDKIGIPSIDYDDNQNIIWKEYGETIHHKESVNLKRIADQINDQPLIKYFLDGSRRVFKVDDIAYENQIFPVVAGQIGVACCKRENSHIKCEKFYKKLVLTLPKKSNPEGWGDDLYFKSKLDSLNKSEELKKLGLVFSAIIPYKTNSEEFENKAIAKIQDYMIESEKEMVAELVKDKLLGQDDYLLKDGSLQYHKTSSKKEESHSLKKIKNRYNWVIGVSKSFNPELCLDNKGKKNSNYIAELKVFHRTPVAKYYSSQVGEDVYFGIWYIRLRDKLRTQTPFDGVVKVEKIMMDNEIEDGIDSDTIDLISANIINERNPTCYGKDHRWANHLYPIYLTESYAKSQYLNTNTFLSLF